MIECEFGNLTSSNSQGYFTRLILTYNKLEGVVTFDFGMISIDLLLGIVNELFGYLLTLRTSIRSLLSRSSSFLLGSKLCSLNELNVFDSLYNFFYWFALNFFVLVLSWLDVWLGVWLNFCVLYWSIYILLNIFFDFLHIFFDFLHIFFF